MMNPLPIFCRIGLLLICGFACLLPLQSIRAQDASLSEQAQGSRTAKNGFANEDQIAAKFESWRTDADAQAWLIALGHRLDEIRQVETHKPHGFKADIEVHVYATGHLDKSEVSKSEVSKSKANDGGAAGLPKAVHRISIKLVSSEQGFNQIDKRWVKTYAAMWHMPDEVHESLRRFVGEVPPEPGSRQPERMYLNELDTAHQQAVLRFFSERKLAIVSDMLAGDGPHAAAWLMVTLKSSVPTRWRLVPMDQAVRFFADGEVAMTRAGNLKIGRISMQRKGGDNGRESAKMLQFKMNPALVFELPQTSAP